MDINHDLKLKIEKYIEKKFLEKKEKREKEWKKAQDECGDNLENLSIINEKIEEEKIELEKQYRPVQWISSAAKRASQIKLITHTLKSTHTDASGSSVFFSKGNELGKYLCTHSISALQMDITGNAAALDVGNFLKIESGEICLIDLIEKDDSSIFQNFSQNEDEIAFWMSSFKETLKQGNLSSHTLSKQIYFPVSKDSYHLLSPLFASSLSQEIFDRIQKNIFGDEQKSTRKSKKDGTYSDQMTIEYRNLALQKFGGTKPQNVSLLNSRRGGKSYLLNNQPPVWKNLEFSTLNLMKKNSFIREYERFYYLNGKKVYQIAYELKGHLELYFKKKNSMAIRDKRADLVDELMDAFVLFSSQIQSQSKSMSGWSQASELSEHEKFWLDPYFDDSDFQKKRQENKWQKSICGIFAKWLNDELSDSKDKNFVLGSGEHDEWIKLIHKKIKFLEKIVEAF